MKKIMLIILCSCFVSVHAQNSCKDCIQHLYNTLKTSHSDTISIGDNTYYKKNLRQDKNDSIISSAIFNAKVFCYGNPLDSVVLLQLEDKVLYFMVSTEPPRSFTYSDINCIYDCNGCNLLNKKDCMKFAGIINDPDGYTYIREGPSTKYRVKYKIFKNNVFLYTPVVGKKWYRVYSKDGSQLLGYINRKRIFPYDKCPATIKKKINELMF